MSKKMQDDNTVFDGLDKVGRVVFVVGAVIFVLMILTLVVALFL